MYLIDSLFIFSVFTLGTFYFLFELAENVVGREGNWHTTGIHITPAEPPKSAVEDVR